MIIEITEDKVNALSENIEKALHYAGKAMQCVVSMRDAHQYNERVHYRDPYMGFSEQAYVGGAPYYPHHPMDGMHERQHRDAYGRFM